MQLLVSLSPCFDWQQKQQRTFFVAVSFTGAGDGAPAPRCAGRSTPPSQARSGGFLKTAHWAVFLTEAHLIGSSPCLRLATKTATNVLRCRWFHWSGRRESNPRCKLGKLLPHKPSCGSGMPSDLPLSKSVFINDTIHWKVYWKKLEELTPSETQNGHHRKAMMPGQGWSGRRESNPRCKLGKLKFYH